MRSARSRISSSSVEISSTPIPSAAAARSRLDMYSMAPTSRPRVGWAATRTAGRWLSSRPSTTRCWLPPDRLRIGAHGLAAWMSYVAIRSVARRCSARRSMHAEAGHRADAVERRGSRRRSCRARTRCRGGPPGSRRRRRGPSTRPVRCAPARPATSTLPAVERDQARQQVAELALPVALDARHADDLAGAHVETRARRARATPLRRTVASRDAQHDGVGRSTSSAAASAAATSSTTSMAPSGRGLAAQRHRPTDHRPGERRPPWRRPSGRGRRPRRGA